MKAGSLDISQAAYHNLLQKDLRQGFRLHERCGTSVGAGYQQSFQSIARIFAPTIFGFLYDHYDQRLTYWINAGTTVCWLIHYFTFHSFDI